MCDKLIPHIETRIGSMRENTQIHGPKSASLLLLVKLVPVRVLVRHKSATGTVRPKDAHRVEIGVTCVRVHHGHIASRDGFHDSQSHRRFRFIESFLL